MPNLWTITRSCWQCQTTVRTGRFSSNSSVLNRLTATSRLLRLHYRQCGGTNSVLRYHSQDTTGNPRPSVDLSNEEALDEHTWLRLDGGNFSIPERLEINGRKGRRAVCVIFKDRCTYKIYDLEGPSEKTGLNANNDDVVML